MPSTEDSITDQRQVEIKQLAAAVEERTAELAASQNRLRGQERLVTVGTLAAGISHQINIPIEPTLTSADFAPLTTDEENRTEIRREALKDIRAQAVQGWGQVYKQRQLAWM